MGKHNHSVTPSTTEELHGFRLPLGLLHCF